METFLLGLAGGAALWIIMIVLIRIIGGFWLWE